MNGEPQKQNLLIPILIAALGPLASIAVAWITTTHSAAPAAKAAVDEQVLATVGTVIASLVSPEKFAEINKDSKGWDPHPGHSNWVPADGRDVSGSGYTLAGLGSTVPDLRGLFLRGLNYAEAGKNRKDEFADPDPDSSSRTPTSTPQPDRLQGHSHKYPVGTNVLYKDGPFAGATGADVFSSDRILEPRTLPPYGEVRFGPETRPKNSAVFYYIRIN